jgi:hypothetical protein
MAKASRVGKARPARARRKAASAGKGGRRWTQGVTEESNALDLEQGVFTLNDPKEIAASLKRSAQRSRRRKAEPYRSALSMLTFYINRAGRNLPVARRKVLMRAKDELRKLFGRG